MKRKSLDAETKEKIIELYRQGYPIGQISDEVQESEFDIIRFLERVGLRRAM